MNNFVRFVRDFFCGIFFPENIPIRLIFHRNEIEFIPRMMQNCKVFGQVLQELEHFKWSQILSELLSVVTQFKQNPIYTVLNQGILSRRIPEPV